MLLLQKKMDSDEEPLIKHKLINESSLKEPKIILKKLSKVQMEILKKKKRISLNNIFSEIHVYHQLNSEKNEASIDPTILDLKLPKNSNVPKQKFDIKSDFESKICRDKDVRPISKNISSSLLPYGPELPQSKKTKCDQCSIESLLQCFPVASNQNDLKIEVVVPPKLLRKKQRRYGRIVIDLNSLSNVRNDSIIVEYQDPETKKIVNFFSINNVCLNKHKSRLKQKTYKELNVVKAKAYINHKSIILPSNANTTDQILTSMESPPRNVSSKTLIVKHSKLECDFGDVSVFIFFKTKQKNKKICLNVYSIVHLRIFSQIPIYTQTALCNVVVVWHMESDKARYHNEKLSISQCPTFRVP